MTRARDLATSAINAFSDADHTHLNNIEANADVTDATNVVAALTAGTNVAIASDGTVSSADTTKLPLTGGTVTGDIDLLQAKHIRWKHEAGGTLRASISAEENDKLQLNTGVSETARMTIDTDGKVGIGVTAPDYALDVSSTVQIRSGEALRLQNAAGNSAATINCDGAGTNSDLKFTTAGAEVMRIDNTGAVTKPKQPAFLVHPASAQNNITVGSSPDTVVWGTERFDNNADFASNTFTAPVTGKYQINVNLYVNIIDVDSDYYELQVVSSNKTYFHAFDPGGLSSDPYYWLMSLNQLIDMDASDTALIRFKQGTALAQTDIAVHSFFSGYLVC